jgi:hypothetical protein
MSKASHPFLGDQSKDFPFAFVKAGENPVVGHRCALPSPASGRSEAPCEGQKPLGQTCRLMGAGTVGDWNGDAIQRLIEAILLAD